MSDHQLWLDLQPGSRDSGELAGLGCLAGGR